jgi:poly(A) polymerase
MEQLQSTDIKPKRQRIPGRRSFVSVTSPDLNKIPVPEEIVQQIGKLADQMKVRLYCVGGYVRDYYLKRERSDFDFTVIGDAIEFAEELADLYGVTPVLYPRFRTAMVPIHNLKLEFVGTRKEEYTPGSRNPIVSEGTLEDDLRRRDFTINAMAVSINSDTFGEVIDAFNGRRDLEAKILRTPTNPETTFSEDPLRMMRAIRFASQFSFFIDKIALNAITRLSSRISIISQERITDEFMKIMSSDKPGFGINLLHETGILALIFPELENMSGIDIIREGSREYAHKDVLHHSLLVLDNIAGKSDNLWLRFAALLHDVGKPKTKRFVSGTGWTFHGHEEYGARMIERIFRRMKMPMEHIDYVETLVRLHQRPMVLVDQGVTDSAVRRLAFNAGAYLEDLFVLCKADITTNNPRLSQQYLHNYEVVTRKVRDVQEKDKLREFQSPVRGEEIMAVCNLQPSRVVGFIKNQIEEAILDGIIDNEYGAAKAFFLENKDNWLKDYELKYNS